MEPGDILKGRLERAGISFEEYQRVIRLNPKPTPRPASDKMLELLEKHVAMKPGPEKNALWEEIHSLFGPVADELHEITKQRPSAYVLAEKLKEDQKRWDEAHPAPKKPTIWNLLFGKKK